MWRYHRPGFFVHNVFAIWGCILSIMFVHFVHNVPAFCAWGSCILRMALCFFMYFKHSLSSISMIKFCPLWQWESMRLLSLCAHTVHSLCTNTGVITWLIGMSTMQRIHKRNCYPCSPLTILSSFTQKYNYVEHNCQMCLMIPLPDVLNDSTVAIYS